MNVSFYIKAIEEYVKQYKDYADELGKAYVAAYDAIQKEASGMQGKYTPEYIKEFSEKGVGDLKKKLQKQLQEMRTKQGRNIPQFLKLVKKDMDKYFMSPASDSFMSAINLISASGMKLTASEMAFLTDNAKTYFEKRAINQLIANHTSGLQEGEVYYTGNDYYKHEKAAVPDMGGAYVLFKQFSDEAINFVDNYTGEKMVLSDKPLSERETWVAGTKCHFFENRTGEKLLEKLGEACAICPYENVTTLSEEDKTLIDVLINSAYGYTAKNRAVEIAKASPEIASKLILDERYKDVVINAIGAE